MAYVHIFYVPLLAFGFFANNLLMVAVAHTTPKSLKVCLLFKISKREIISDLFNSHLLRSVEWFIRHNQWWISFREVKNGKMQLTKIIANSRLIVKLPSFTYVALGPCRLISGDLCNYCNSIMTSGLVQSIVLQSISFGYRCGGTVDRLKNFFFDHDDFSNYILTRPSPSSRAIHVVVVVATLPNNLHLVFFVSMLLSASIVACCRSCSSMLKYRILNFLPP